MLLFPVSPKDFQSYTPDIDFKRVHIMSDVKNLLRFAEEPMLHISEIDCHGILMDHCAEFMENLSGFYKKWASDRAAVNLPVKQVFVSEDVAGDFRIMPCIIPSNQVKFVKIIGTNEEERVIKDKICVGKAMLIDHHDNYVYAIFDVCSLSSFRTAAISCLALKSSHVDPISVGVIGAGRIGFYTAFILYTWMGLRKFYVADKSDENLSRFNKLREIYIPEAIVEQTSVDNLCAHSSAVFLTTTSDLPLCNAKNCANVPFVSSVGADADNLSEIDESMLASHSIITDSLQSMYLGDMKKWQAAGLIRQSDVVELTDMIAGSATVKNNMLFISTGVAVQDAIVSKFIYDKFTVLA